MSAAVDYVEERKRRALAALDPSRAVAPYDTAIAGTQAARDAQLSAAHADLTQRGAGAPAEAAVRDIIEGRVAARLTQMNQDRASAGTRLGGLGTASGQWFDSTAGAIPGIENTVALKRLFASIQDQSQAYAKAGGGQGRRGGGGGGGRRGGGGKAKSTSSRGSDWYYQHGLNETFGGGDPGRNRFNTYVAQKGQLRGPTKVLAQFLGEPKEYAQAQFAGLPTAADIPSVKEAVRSGAAQVKAGTLTPAQYRAGVALAKKAEKIRKLKKP